MGAHPSRIGLLLALAVLPILAVPSPSPAVVAPGDGLRLCVNGQWVDTAHDGWRPWGRIA